MYTACWSIWKSEMDTFKFHFNINISLYLPKILKSSLKSLTQFILHEKPIKIVKGIPWVNILQKPHKINVKSCVYKTVQICIPSLLVAHYFQQFVYTLFVGLMANYTCACTPQPVLALEWAMMMADCLRASYWPVKMTGGLDCWGPDWNLYGIRQHQMLGLPWQYLHSLVWKKGSSVNTVKYF